MRARPFFQVIGMACVFHAESSPAADGPTADRLSFSASGSTLTGDRGGGGGSVGWLHNFDPETLAGAEIEYQTISNAHWTFGSLSGSATRGPAGARLSVYGEVHEGAGDIGPHAFDYSIVAVGIIRTFGPRFSLQLEDRQIDIDTTHGNLPKLGATFVWNPRFQSAISYAHSVGGNLGTELVSVRVDGYAGFLNWLGGGAAGKASPQVVNLQTGVVTPGSTLKEGFAGVSKPFAHSKVTLVADYLNLAGIKRTTLTISYVVDLGASGKAR